MLISSNVRKRISSGCKVVWYFPFLTFEEMSIDKQQQPGQGKGMKVIPHMPDVFREKPGSPYGK